MNIIERENHACPRTLAVDEQEAKEMMPESGGGEVGALCSRAWADLRNLYQLHKEPGDPEDEQWFGVR